MSVHNYLYELSQQLQQLTPVEFDEAMRFYQEYAQEAELTDYAQMVERFGTPKALSSQIYAEAAVKQFSPAGPAKVNLFKGFGWVFLAILSLPLSFPLLIVAISLVFTLVVVVGALLFSAVVTAIAVGIKGLFLLGYSFLTFAQDGLWAWMERFGDGLLHLSLGILFGFLAYYMTKYVAMWSAMAISNLSRKDARHA